MTASRQFRLFQFPYAGGGVSAFAAWKAMVPEWLDLVTIEAPGGYVDPPQMTVQEMAETGASEILQRDDLPYALFGHSMGALVSFEVARIVAKGGQSSPRLLLVAGHGAPHLPSSGEAVHELPNAEFDCELERLSGTPQEVLNNPELMEVVRPRLRRDFKTSRCYSFAEGRSLQIPIQVLGGLRDAETTDEKLRAWQEHTSGPCHVQMFAGGHFFIHEQRGLVLRYICNLLLKHSRPD